ncbi:hypothetical protein [Thiomonas sp. FB-Cd]|uniref:hypothetical protein n=1 Tax=Thiomonas sp. FB-Cd TaxID=1158292 RepID=UPI0004DF2262|nr:hypothetical protein [Thiomonas sp. FB-Cd]
MTEGTKSARVKRKPPKPGKKQRVQIETAALPPWLQSYAKRIDEFEMGLIQDQELFNGTKSFSSLHEWFDDIKNQLDEIKEVILRYEADVPNAEFRADLLDEVIILEDQASTCNSLRGLDDFCDQTPISGDFCRLLENLHTRFQDRVYALIELLRE